MTNPHLRRPPHTTHLVSGVPDYKEIDMTDRDLSHVSKQAIDRPIGIFCDIRATTSVIGRKEMDSIFRSLRLINFILPASRHRFLFADSVYPSVVETSLLLYTPVGIKSFYVQLDIFELDIP